MFDPGHIEIPEAWAYAIQLEFVEPLSTTSAPLLAKATKPKPSANVILRRGRAAKDATPANALDILTKDIVATRGVRIRSRSSFEFSDGIVGECLRITVPYNAQIDAVQLHVVRIDGNFQTHLTLTGVAGDDQLASLERVVASFRP
jgi:hypothetical protein